MFCYFRRRWSEVIHTSAIFDGCSCQGMKWSRPLMSVRGGLGRFHGDALPLPPRPQLQQCEKG